MATEKMTAEAADMHEHIDRLKAAIPSGETVEARDWAGFFTALGDFFAKVAPALLPLILKANTTPPAAS